MQKYEKEMNQVLENILNSALYSLGNFIKKFFVGAFFGFKKLREKKFFIGFLFMLLVLGLSLVFKDKFNYIHNKIYRYISYWSCLFSPLIYLYFLSGSNGNKNIYNDLKIAGIIGMDGKVPVLLNKQNDSKGYEIYTFKGLVNFSIWKKKIEDLETVMNITIKELKQGKSKKIVIIKAVPGTILMPGDDGIPLLWNDDYIKEKDGVVSLGRNELEEITADFNKDPHFIAAGATGSGKSVIIRCILWQFIAKGHKVILVDFKGALEFGEAYQRYGDTITDKKSLAKQLDVLLKENELRQAELGRVGAKNINDYNKKSDKRMYRVLLIIDELGEVLDKSGLNDEEKELTQKIEGALSSFARVSRATGIHMLFGIQRPDAKIITGQIKTNVTGRICGRVSDGPASEIVLNSTAAAQLPKIGGRMIYQNGGDMEVFQGYFFQDDRDVKKLKVPGDRLLVGGDIGRYDGAELITGKFAVKQEKRKNIKKKNIFKDIIKKLKSLIFFKKKWKEKKMIEMGADPDLLDLDTLYDNKKNIEYGENTHFGRIIVNKDIIKEDDSNIRKDNIKNNYDIEFEEENNDEYSF